MKVKRGIRGHGKCHTRKKKKMVSIGMLKQVEVGGKEGVKVSVESHNGAGYLYG